MVGAGVVTLVLAVFVESRTPEPVVPLGIVRRRTPALAILASLAVGMAMFGGAVFLGQYFQIGRGYTPTEAGLLARHRRPVTDVYAVDRRGRRLVSASGSSWIRQCTAGDRYSFSQSDACAA
jgi:hypothetical protein